MIINSIKIKIFEKENKYIKDNIFLWNLILDIVSKKVENSEIEISFTIDEYLFLHVSTE